MSDDNGGILIALAGLLGLAGIVSFLNQANARVPAPVQGLDGTTYIPPTGDNDADYVPFNFGTQTMTYNDIYKKYASRFSLDWRLIKAIAVVESSENPNATNPADPSTGLMQILCSADGPNSQCKNRFNIAGWDMATPNKLFDPDFNVWMGSQILSWNVKTYGLARGVATYNRWDSRNDPEFGPFGNQGYVDKVEREYRKLGGSLYP